MTTTYHLTVKSQNGKVAGPKGRRLPAAVSTTSADTCPPSCPMRAACYAKSGHLGNHWRMVTDGERGTDLDGFTDALQSLPDGYLFRHNQAGDLPGNNGHLDRVDCAKLANASAHLDAWTYTHAKPETGDNGETLDLMAQYQSAHGLPARGLTVNISCDSLAEVDSRWNDGRPLTVVLPENAPEVTITPAGNVVRTCPAVTGQSESCATCRLCARPNRPFAIGFPVHGSLKSRFTAK